MTKTRLADALKKATELASQKEGLDGFNSDDPKKQENTPTDKEKPVMLNKERVPVTKGGFLLPETDYQQIKICAAKRQKKIQDLLAEIVKDWLKKNN